MIMKTSKRSKTKRGAAEEREHGEETGLKEKRIRKRQKERRKTNTYFNMVQLDALTQSEFNIYIHNLRNVRIHTQIYGEGKKREENKKGRQKKKTKTMTTGRRFKTREKEWGGNRIKRQKKKPRQKERKKITHCLHPQRNV